MGPGPLFWGPDHFFGVRTTFSGSGPLFRGPDGSAGPQKVGGQAGPGNFRVLPILYPPLPDTTYLDIHPPVTRLILPACESLRYFLLTLNCDPNIVGGGFVMWSGLLLVVVDGGWEVGWMVVGWMVGWLSVKLGSDSSGEGGPSSGFFWPRNPVSWTPGTPVSGSGTPFNRPDPRN